MPFDGVVLKSIVYELKEKLNGGRIDKIFQPETDEIVLNIRSQGNPHRLLLCANPSMPRIHLTAVKKENPMNAPNFCMVLRKHLSGSKIIDINSFGFERIFALDVETYSELMDKQVKRLIVEVMGKHSNIILINENNKIIDAIKHIDRDISSVREIMPARKYSFPPMQDKIEPDSPDVDRLFELGPSKHKKAETFLLDSLMGFSPFLSRSICDAAGVDPKTPVEDLTSQDISSLQHKLSQFRAALNQKQFDPCVLYDEKNMGHYLEFHCFSLSHKPVRIYPSISTAVDEFFIKKDIYERLKQRKSDLLKTLHSALDKVQKKIYIYSENLREVATRDHFKLYGDLILAFIHSIPENSDKVILTNFYSENCEDIEVPLDPTVAPQTVAARFYKKYNKAKNTFENCSKLLTTCHEDLKYLENLQYLLESAQNNEEIEEIRLEMIQVGILHSKHAVHHFKKHHPKKLQPLGQPYHFVSSDGYDIWVGKNNLQNDRLTLKDARANDLWLHTKDIPGSHVVIKKQKEDIPQSTILEAALLAAYFSKSRLSSKVPVDYTQIKFVKKAPGNKPGMVHYTHQKTLFVTPDQELLQKFLQEKEV